LIFGVFMEEKRDYYLWVLKACGIKDAERLANTMLGVMVLLDEEGRIIPVKREIKKKCRLVRRV